MLQRIQPENNEFEVKIIPIVATFRLAHPNLAARVTMPIDTPQRLVTGLIHGPSVYKRLIERGQEISGFDFNAISPDRTLVSISEERTIRSDQDIIMKGMKSKPNRRAGWVGKILGTSTGMSSTTSMVESPESG
ncbi:hypothetical protein Tco_0835493 [Tanacetum coccineum]